MSEVMEKVSLGEIGKVVAQEGKILVVEMEKKEACAKCRACSAGLEGKTMVIRAQNLCNAQIGDNVEVRLDNSDFLRAVLIMYGIPFLAFATGIFAGYYGWSFLIGAKAAELAGFVLGIAFVLAAYGIIKLNEPRFKRGNYVPKAIARV